MFGRDLPTTGRMILSIYCGAGTTILIPVNSSIWWRQNDPVYLLWCRDNNTDPCKQLPSGGRRIILCIYCGAGTTILIPVNRSIWWRQNDPVYLLWCRDNNTDPCKQLPSGGRRMILCIYCGVGTTILIPVNSSHLVEEE